MFRESGHNDWNEVALSPEKALQHKALHAIQEMDDHQITAAPFGNTEWIIVTVPSDADEQGIPDRVMDVMNHIPYSKYRIVRKKTL